MFVIRKKLYADEGAPPNTRVNPTTGEVEITTDGGATWTPNPTSDPRQNPGYQLPPPGGVNARCAAAAGMVEDVRKVVDAGLAFGTVGGLATALLPLLLIPGIGWMYLAVLLFASVVIIALGGGLYAAMTEEVYDELLCIFNDNINPDGTVTWAQLENIHSAVETAFGNALITDFIGGLFQYQREVGVTNAGIAYADPDADCSECTYICNFYLGGDGLKDMTLVFDTQYDAINDWVLNDNLGGAATYASWVIPFPAETLFSAGIIGTWANQSANGSMQLYAINGLDFGDLVLLDDRIGTTDGDHTQTFMPLTIPAGYDGLYCTMQAIGTGATVTIKAFDTCLL